MTKISQETLEKRARRIADLIGVDKVVVAVKEGDNPVVRGVYDKNAGEDTGKPKGINPAVLKGRIHDAYNYLIDSIDEYKKENSEYFNEDGTLNEAAVKETACKAAKKVIDTVDMIVGTAKSKALFQHMFPGMSVETVSDPDFEPASVKVKDEDPEPGCGNGGSITEAMKIFDEIKKVQHADSFEKEADEWCGSLIAELRKRVKTRNFNPLLDNETDQTPVGIRIKIGGTVHENLDKIIKKYQDNGLLDSKNFNKVSAEFNKAIENLAGELGFSDAESDATSDFIIVDFKF